MSVCGYSHGDSILLFVPWDLGSVHGCKCVSAILFLVSPSAWCLSIVTDGHASSDWSPGPMLMDVRLGVICVVIGSFLICFSFLCLCF